MPGSRVYKDVAEVRKTVGRFARIAANEPEHARFSYARSRRRNRRRRRRRLSLRQIPRLRLAARPICWILGRRRDRIRHERVPHAECPFPIARRLAGRRDLSRAAFEKTNACNATILTQRHSPCLVPAIVRSYTPHVGRLYVRLYRSYSFSYRRH